MKIHRRFPTGAALLLTASGFFCTAIVSELVFHAYRNPKPVAYRAPPAEEQDQSKVPASTALAAVERRLGKSDAGDTPHPNLRSTGTSPAEALQAQTEPSTGTSPAEAFQAQTEPSTETRLAEALQAQNEPSTGTRLAEALQAQNEPSTGTRLAEAFQAKTGPSALQAERDALLERQLSIANDLMGIDR